LVLLPAEETQQRHLISFAKAFLSSILLFMNVSHFS